MADHPSVNEFIAGIHANILCSFVDLDHSPSSDASSQPYSLANEAPHDVMQSDGAEDSQFSDGRSEDHHLDRGRPRTFSSETLPNEIMESIFPNYQRNETNLFPSYPPTYLKSEPSVNKAFGDRTLPLPPTIDQSPRIPPFRSPQTALSLPSITISGLPDIGIRVTQEFMDRQSKACSWPPPPADGLHLPPFAHFFELLPPGVSADQASQLGRPYLPHILETRSFYVVTSGEGQTFQQANWGDNQIGPEMKPFDPKASRDLHRIIQYRTIVKNNKIELGIDPECSP